MSKKLLADFTTATTFVIISTVSAQALEETTLNVIAGVSTMNQTKLGELPFYETTLVEDSEGMVTASVTSIDQLNIGGTEVMRLIEAGVTDIGTSAFAYFGNEVPAASGVDLPGLFTTVDELRAGVDAYRSIIDETLAKEYNAKLLGVWSISSITLFCRGDVTSLADLKGKNIRSYGSMLSALYEGLALTQSLWPMLRSCQLSNAALSTARPPELFPGMCQNGERSLIRFINCLSARRTGSLQ